MTASAPYAGRQVGAGQLGGDDQRVGVPGGQLVVAVDGQLPPVLHGRPGQAGAVQAPPGAQQQRMAPVGPQDVGGRALQAGRVRAQRDGRPWLRLVDRPRFQQRAGRRPRRPLVERGGGGQLDRGLQHRAHQDRRPSLAPVDSDQTGPFADEQRVPGGLGVDWRAEPDGGAAQVDADRLGVEDRAGNPVAVEQGDEDQHEPDRLARQQLLGLAEGQRPGDRGGRGDLARRHPDLLPPADEVVPVVPAGQRRVGDHRGGLGQGQRLTAERLDEVDGTLALSRVHAEPLGQAAEGLTDAEEADREDPRPVPAGRDGRLRAGDQEPARRAFGPEPVKLVHAGQVVQHDQPRLIGFGEPADEAGRDRFGGAGRLDAGGRHPCLDVPREHRRPAGGGDPDHHVDGAGSP